MDYLATPPVPPAFHLTRHGGLRLATRTSLNEDALFRLLNERQSVIIEKGDRRKPRLFLIYSQPDSDFFVIAANQRTRAVITVLPLRYYECRVPGKPRIVSIKDLLQARSRAMSGAERSPDPELSSEDCAVEQESALEEQSAEREPSGVILHLKLICRKRDGNVTREWREVFAIALDEDTAALEDIHTEKALLAHPGFLGKMGEVLSACEESWQHVCQMYTEIQHLSRHKTAPRRKIHMPWTCLSIEQAGDPKACQRFPALQGLILEDEGESFDRYRCPVEVSPEDEVSNFIPALVENMADVRPCEYI